MSVNRTATRSDTATVTEVLSRSYSRTQPCREDQAFSPFTPRDAEKMDGDEVWRQQVVWETYQGVFGSQTLLKRVEHDTSSCPECGGEGWYDHRGEVVCEDDECGVVISDKPLMLPEDGFAGRGTGPGGKAAINPAGPSEPDVQ